MLPCAICIQFTRGFVVSGGEELEKGGINVPLDNASRNFSPLNMFA